MDQWNLRRIARHIVLCAALTSSLVNAQSQRTQAQRLIEIISQNHPEITGLEFSATRPGKGSSITIAATDSKELGEKCDKDEAAVLKTLKPSVEYERNGSDVTVPLHDAQGKLVGILGVDFKREPRQTRAGVLGHVARLLQEIERQIPSKDFLFELAH